MGHSSGVGFGAAVVLDLYCILLMQIINNFNVVLVGGAQGQPNVVYVQGQPQHKTVYVEDKSKSKGTGKMLAGRGLS